MELISFDIRNIFESDEFWPLIPSLSPSTTHSSKAQTRKFMRSRVFLSNALHTVDGRNPAPVDM